MNDDVRVFSPATVSNVACGFDILGFPLESVGDEMTVRKTQERGLKINNLSDFDLPVDINQNVASVSALALIDVLKPDCGFEIDIIKKIKPGSGIGSSGASAAGCVFAINKLMGDPFTVADLIKFAMKGEIVSSVSEHADNIAPALFGGIILIRSYEPLDILNLPVPKSLFSTVVLPKFIVNTLDARRLLPKRVPLKSAVEQAGNLAGFTLGLYESDFNLFT